MDDSVFTAIGGLGISSEPKPPLLKLKLAQYVEVCIPLGRSTWPSIIIYIIIYIPYLVYYDQSESHAPDCSACGCITVWSARLSKCSLWGEISGQRSL